MEAEGGPRTEVAAELEREDTVVLKPLISRMGEVAELLDQGNEVEPGYLARGFGLWKRYGTELHPERVQHVLGPISTTLVLGVSHAARPERRRRREEKKGAGAQASQQELLLRDYQSIVHNQTMSESRIGELEMLRTLYAQQGFGARERLASVLKAFVLSEEAWASFEVDFVQKAMEGASGGDVEARLREGLDKVAAARSRLEPEIQRFVAEPIPTTPGNKIENALGALNAELGAVEAGLRPSRRGKPPSGT